MRSPLPVLRRGAAALTLVAVATTMVVAPTSPVAAQDMAEYAPQDSGGVPQWRYSVPSEWAGDLLVDIEREQSFYVSNDGVQRTDLVTLQTEVIDARNFRTAAHVHGDDRAWLLRAQREPGRQLVELDLETLEIVRTFDLGTDEGCADDLAVLPTHLLVTVGCYAEHPVLAVDLQTGKVTPSTSIPADERGLNRRIAAQGDDGAILYDLVDDRLTLHRVQLDGATPRVVKTRVLEDRGYVQDVSASPTTGHVVVSTFDEAIELHGTTLAERHRYPVGRGASSVTHDPSGEVVLGGGNQVRQYAAGASTPRRVTDVFDGPDSGGLTLAGDRLFVTGGSIDEFGGVSMTVLPFGTSHGTISGALRSASPAFADESPIDIAFVDVFRADDDSYVGTITPRFPHNGAAQFVIDGLPPGGYRILGGNAYGYFAEWHVDAPLFRYDRARNITVKANRTARADITLRPLYEDMWDTPFTNEIAFLGDTGITSGCNPADGNTLFCPDGLVTRGAMAAFLVRALGLTDDGGMSFRDTRGHVFERDIARLAAAGITRGCNPPANDRFCPDAPVTRGQMAAFLSRAFGLPRADVTFADTRGHTFEGDVARLADAGITRGCNPQQGNTRFCPDDDVTRGQMAAFLFRSFQWLGRELGFAAMEAPTGPHAGGAGAARAPRPDLRDR